MWRQGKNTLFYIDNVGRVWQVWSDGHVVLTVHYAESVRLYCKGVRIPYWGHKCLIRITALVEAAYKQLQEQETDHNICGYKARSQSTTSTTTALSGP